LCDSCISCKHNTASGFLAFMELWPTLIRVGQETKEIGIIPAWEVPRLSLWFERIPAADRTWTDGDVECKVTYIHK